MLYIHCSFSASQPLSNGGRDADNEQCLYNIAHYLHLGHFGGWDADNESLPFQNSAIKWWGCVNVQLQVT